MSTYIITEKYWLVEFLAMDIKLQNRATLSPKKHSEIINLSNKEYIIFKLKHMTTQKL